MRGSTLHVTFGVADDAIEGRGEATVQLMGAGGIIKKSQTALTVVEHALDLSRNPPDPVEHWLRAMSARLIKEGGTEGQVLTKKSDDDFDAGWEDTRGGKPYLSLERVARYLYNVSFADAPDTDAEDFAPAMCSSYVQGGKLYRNLDWNYDNTATFHIRLPGIEGLAFAAGLTDTELNDELIAQLPYRMVDGVNEHGIMVSTHVLYNDWQWHGGGNTPLTRLPYLALSKVHSMATLETDLADVLGDLKSTAALDELEYLIQVLVTDGTTSYVLRPTTGGIYEAVDISDNAKLSNFLWVEDATVDRADLQLRPTGVERWNMMPCPLEELRFTKAYETPDRLSEFIGINGTDKDSTDEELTAIYNLAHAEYLDRERDGETWQTMHSAVYSQKGLEHLWIQEDWEKDYIASSCGGGTGDHTELINRNALNQHPISSITGLEDALDLKISETEKGVADGIATLNGLGMLEQNVNPGKIPFDYPGLYDNRTIGWFMNNTINDVSNVKAVIPASASGQNKLVSEAQLDNKGYITKAVADLANYYLKTETYTQAEVNALIAAIQKVTLRKVTVLPETGETNVIYLVPKTGTTQDVFDEWIWVDNAWEHIGTTEVDLSGYYTKTESDAKYVAKETGKGLSANDYTTAEKEKLSRIAAGGVKLLEYGVSTFEEAFSAFHDGNLLVAFKTVEFEDGTTGVGYYLPWEGAYNETDGMFQFGLNEGAFVGVIALSSADGWYDFGDTQPSANEITYDPDEDYDEGTVGEAISGKQAKITASGILQGDGQGGVTAVPADYFLSREKADEIAHFSLNLIAEYKRGRLSLATETEMLFSYSQWVDGICVIFPCVSGKTYTASNSIGKTFDRLNWAFFTEYPELGDTTETFVYSSGTTVTSALCPMTGYAVFCGFNDYSEDYIGTISVVEGTEPPTGEDITTAIDRIARRGVTDMSSISGNTILTIGDSLTNVAGGGVATGKRWQKIVVDNLHFPASQPAVLSGQRSPTTGIIPSMRESWR